MKIVQWMLLLVLFIGLPGCSTIESLLPASAPAASGTILYADDFSDPKGWGAVGNSGGSVSFDYQGLEIKINTPNSLYWTVNGKSYQDMQIDVDAVLLSGPMNDNFGVICRYANNKNFYAFIISHDGYYGMFKSIDGVVYPLLPDAGMQYSETIRQGGIVNHIQVVCQGSKLTLNVNGEEMASANDTDLARGQFGLIAGAYDLPGVDVFFDNLLVKQP